jgi:hypothetical protein
MVDGLEQVSAWRAVVDQEPALAVTLSDAEFDGALRRAGLVHALGRLRRVPGDGRAASVRPGRQYYLQGPPKFAGFVTRGVASAAA